MWRWIKHWRDWAMNEIVTPHRIVSQPQALYFSCEKAGLLLQNQPIPWGAESVLVEALLRLPPAARKKADFSLRMPGYDAVPAESIRKDDTSDKHRLFFRFNPPVCSTIGEVYWRHHPLGKIDLPLLTADEFARELRAHLPTVFVDVGGQNVAAQSFVANQCKGLDRLAPSCAAPPGWRRCLTSGSEVSSAGNARAGPTRRRSRLWRHSSTEKRRWWRRRRRRCPGGRANGLFPGWSMSGC